MLSILSYRNRTIIYMVHSLSLRLTTNLLNICLSHYAEQEDTVMGIEHGWLQLYD